MGRIYVEQTLGPLQAADGAAYASSVTLTDVSPGAATGGIAVEPDQLDLGALIRVFSAFTASNTGTPTLLAGVYFGAVAGTALAATTAVTTTTAMTNWRWEIELIGVIQAVGSAAKFMPLLGHVKVPTSLTAWTIRPIPETALAQVTIDNSARKLITIGAQWGTSSASNTLTDRGCGVELLN